MNFTKTNNYNNVGELIDDFQKPIQLQFLAFEELLKFQKNKMPENIWQNYINVCEKYFINDLKRIFEEIKQ